MSSEIRFSEQKLPVNPAQIDTLSGSYKSSDGLHLIGALSDPVPAGHFNQYILFITGDNWKNRRLSVRWRVYAYNGSVHYQSPLYYLEPFSASTEENKRELNRMGISPDSFWASCDLTVRMPGIGHCVRVEAHVTELSDDDPEKRIDLYYTDPKSESNIVKQASIELTNTLVRPIPVVFSSLNHSVSSMSYIANAYNGLIRTSAAAQYPNGVKKSLLGLLLSAVLYSSLYNWQKMSVGLNDNIIKRQLAPDSEVGSYDPEFALKYPADTADRDIWLTIKPDTGLYDIDNSKEWAVFRWYTQDEVVGAGKNGVCEKKNFDSLRFFDGRGLCGMSAGALYMTDNGAITELEKYRDKCETSDSGSKVEIKIEDAVGAVNKLRFPRYTISAAAKLLKDRIEAAKNLSLNGVNDIFSEKNSKAIESILADYYQYATLRKTSLLSCAKTSVTNYGGLFLSLLEPREWTGLADGASDFEPKQGKTDIGNFAVTSLQCALVQTGFLSASEISGKLNKKTPEALSELAKSTRFISYSDTGSMTVVTGAQSISEKMPVAADLSAKIKSCLENGRYKSEFSIGEPDGLCFVQDIVALKKKLVELGYWAMDVKTGGARQSFALEYMPLDSKYFRGVVYVFQREHGLDKKGLITNETIQTAAYLKTQMIDGVYQRPGYYVKLKRRKNLELDKIHDQMSLDKALEFTETGMLAQNDPNDPTVKIAVANLYPREKAYAKIHKYYELPPLIVNEWGSDVIQNAPYSPVFAQPSETDIEPDVALKIRYYDQLYGRNDLIRALVSSSKKWKPKDEKKFIGTGAISADNGFQSIPNGHRHYYGVSADVGGAQSNVGNGMAFDRDKAADLAESYLKEGASVILHDCKYVCDVLNRRSYEKRWERGEVYAQPSEQPHQRNLHFDMSLKGAKMSPGYAITVNQDDVQPGLYEAELTVKDGAAQDKYTARFSVPIKMGKRNFGAFMRHITPVSGKKSMRLAPSVRSEILIDMEPVAVSCVKVSVFKKSEGKKKTAVYEQRSSLGWELDMSLPEYAVLTGVPSRANIRFYNASQKLIFETELNVNASDAAQLAQSLTTALSNVITASGSPRVLRESLTVGANGSVLTIERLPSSDVILSLSFNNSPMKEIAATSHKYARYKFTPYQRTSGEWADDAERGAPATLISLEYKRKDTATRVVAFSGGSNTVYNDLGSRKTIVGMIVTLLRSNSELSNEFHIWGAVDDKVASVYVEPKKPVQSAYDRNSVITLQLDDTPQTQLTLTADTTKKRIIHSRQYYCADKDFICPLRAMYSGGEIVKAGDLIENRISEFPDAPAMNTLEEKEGWLFKHTGEHSFDLAKPMPTADNLKNLWDSLTDDEKGTTTSKSALYKKEKQVYDKKKICFYCIDELEPRYYDYLYDDEVKK